MSREQVWIVMGGAVALGLLLCVLLVLVRLRSLRREVRDLRTLVDRVEERPAVRETAPAGHDGETPYVITHVGTERVEPERPDPPAEDVQPGRIEGRLFADLVARETVVKVAGLAHGVRRVLDPEVRHRIRFEMRREVKRSRKQRKADLKEALRDLQARERAGFDAVDGAADRGDAA